MHGRNRPWMFDAHCDTAYMRVFLSGDWVPPEMQIDPEAFFRVTVPRLKEGNVGCLFVNVGDIGLLTSLEIIDYVYRWEAEGDVKVCLDAPDVVRAVESGRIALVMACEGGFLFHEQLDILRNWHRLGVRVVTLSHGEGQEGLGWFAETALKRDSQINATGKSALQVTPSHDGYLSPPKRDSLREKEKGLTSFGRAAVEELIRLGMVADLSHANDATFWDAIAIADEAGGAGKFCCTHSNCAALCPHARNLTDEMMEALAGTGGVMGLCFFGEFIDETNPSLDKFVDHILHALDVLGSDHVGIGTDYDGVPPDAFMAIGHPGETEKLWEALGDAGVSEKVMRKVGWGNFLGLL